MTSETLPVADEGPPPADWIEGVVELEYSTRDGDGAVTRGQFSRMHDLQFLRTVVTEPRRVEGPFAADPEGWHLEVYQIPNVLVDTGQLNDRGQPVFASVTLRDVQIQDIEVVWRQQAQDETAGEVCFGMMRGTLRARFADVKPVVVTPPPVVTPSPTVTPPGVTPPPMGAPPPVVTPPSTPVHDGEVYRPGCAPVGSGLVLAALIAAAAWWFGVGSWFWPWLLVAILSSMVPTLGGGAPGCLTPMRLFALLTIFLMFAICGGGLGWLPLLGLLGLLALPFAMVRLFGRGCLWILALLALAIVLAMGALVGWAWSSWNAWTGASTGTGQIGVSLEWEGPHDLDLIVETPAGERVSWRNVEGENGGRLLADLNRDDASVVVAPLEVIDWPECTAPAGTYTVYVMTHKARAIDYRSFAWTVRVRLGEETRTVHGMAARPGTGGLQRPAVVATTFTYDGQCSASAPTETEADERLIEAMGMGSQEAFRITAAWNTPDDVDLHLLTPDRELVNFAQKTVGGGSLDVDRNADHIDPRPVESISWTGMPDPGEYYAFLHVYRRRTSTRAPIEVRLNGSVPGAEESWVVTLTEADGFGEKGLARLVGVVTVDANGRLALQRGEVWKASHGEEP